MSRAPCLLPCVAVCALSAHAMASPLSDPTAGEMVFTGATMPHATSIEVNPSALGLGFKNELYLAATFAGDQYAIDHAGTHSSDLVLTPGGSAAIVWHTGTDGRITLAFAAGSPPSERFLEGEPSLAYHTLGGYHRRYGGGVAASVRFSRQFYFGVSVGFQKARLRLRYARDTALEAGHDVDRGVDSDCGGSPCGVENPLAMERYDVDVTSDFFSQNAVAVNAGILVNLVGPVWFGLAYHTPPGFAIENDLNGTMDVVRAPRDGGNVLSGGATVYLSLPASIDAELRARLVGDLDLHVGWRWEDLSRLQAYDVRGYGSVFGPAGIPEWMRRPRGFHDPLAMWAGVEQVVERERSVAVGGRIGFETSSVAARRTSPLAIAPTTVLADVGAQFRIDPFVVQLGYGLHYAPTVHVDNSAFAPEDRLACIDSGYDYSTPACKAVRLGYAIPSADGDYRRIEHALRAGVRVEF